MSIEIANESGAAVDEAALADLAGYVLAALQVNPLAELSVLLVDVAYMTELHERWMDEAGPTDVLAFPMDEFDGATSARGPGVDAPEDEPALLGDVVLCPRVAQEQGRHAGHSTEDELHLLCTHGILHLLGYNHAEEDEKREMFGLQQRILDDWRRSRAPRAHRSR